jgi:quinol monooxygenase YgiN
MINIIAEIELVDEKVKDSFLDIFKANVPEVLKENGCVSYVPAVDADSEFAVTRNNVITVVEAWESLDALRNHLKAPHMLDYKEKVKDMVKSVSLKVLSPVK